MLSFSLCFFSDKMASTNDVNEHDGKTDLDEEDDDPVVKMIKKTGCIDYHYKVQVNT